MRFWFKNKEITSLRQTIIEFLAEAEENGINLDGKNKGHVDLVFLLLAKYAGIEEFGFLENLNSLCGSENALRS